MQTSLDLPNQLGIVHTLSLTDVEHTDNNVNQQIQNALLMSTRDKEFRKTNMDQKQDGEQYQVAEIQNGQHTSIIYFMKDNNIDMQFQTSVEDSIKEQDYTRSKLLSIEGILLKKSPHWFQGYEQRYCTLSNRIFRYFNIDRKCLQGVLNFDVQSYQFIEIKEKGIVSEFILKPVGNSDKIFQFKANPEEIKKWATLISEHLNYSMGAIRPLKTLCTYERFWRHERISTQQLLEEGEDGDLLLFRGKDLNCQMQRAFTQSQYDHVAMLVTINNILYFFEALPLHGVGLCKWSSFLSKKWYNLYEKITYRKLQYQRSDQFKQRISIFVNENLGKSYSLNPSKLFKFSSTICHHDENRNQEVQKSRTYFCSELVAACYKSLNLLPKNPSSAQYWPGNFSKENQKLKLGYGELSEEYLIDFAADY